MSYIEKMQGIANQYFEEHNGKRATSREIARWAMEKGLWQPPLQLAEKKCAADLADAMREQYKTIPDGRRIRVKHAARLLDDGKSEMLWQDMEDSDLPFMETAFQGRRQQIFGDAKQLRWDSDYYNEQNPKQQRVRVLLDFEEELEEEEALRKLQQKKQGAA